MNGRSLLLGVAIVGGLALAVGSWFAPRLAWHPAPPPGTPPSLVLVVHGGAPPWLVDPSADPEPGRPAAPTLARLAAEGIRFERAFTPSTDPALAWASLLTGRPGAELGLAPVRDGGGGDPTPVPAPIPEAALLLPEILGLYGYATAGFIGATSQPRGLGQGFSEARLEAGASFAAGVRGAVDWLETRAREPFLLVVGGADGEAPFPDEGPLAGVYLTHLCDGAEASQRAALLGADLQVGLLLEALERQGRLERTVVVVTADRPLDVAWLDAPDSALPLADATTRVPLVLWGAPIGGTPLVRDEAVSTLDVLPTLLALAGARPPAGIPGRDLRTPGTGDERSRRIFQVGPALFAVRTGTHRLVFEGAVPGPSALLVPDAPVTAEGAWHLHDLRVDPTEAADVRAADPVIAADLEASLLAWHRTTEVRAAELGGAPPARAGDPALQEMLRARGYW